MIGIIVIGRLNFSSELIRIVEEIVGVQENLYPVSLSSEESPANITKKIQRALESAQNHPHVPADEILIFSDIYGSTPTNFSVNQCVGIECTEIITGVNTPMLLSALINRKKMNLEALKTKVIEDGKKSIQTAKKAKTSQGAKS